MRALSCCRLLLFLRRFHPAAVNILQKLKLSRAPLIILIHLQLQVFDVEYRDILFFIHLYLSVLTHML